MLKSRSFLLIIFMLITISFIYTAQDSGKNKQFSYTYLRFSFKSPVKLSVYEKIGPKNNPETVVEYSIPNKSDKNKRAKFRLILFQLPEGLKDGPMAVNASLSEKLSYCNSIYLGAGPAKLEKKRKYNGKEILGHMSRSSIPVKGIKESYILKVNKKTELFVGFFYLDTYPIKDISIIIQTIIKSFSIN